MDGRVERPPPAPRAPLWSGLVEISTLICLVSSLSGLQGGGEREAGEAQHVCLTTDRTWERRRCTGKDR